jgi:serine/threonine protein phosphatase PrpC
VRIRDAVTATQRGARDHNEDAILKVPGVPLFAVADGMGGPGAGDVAANVVLDTLKAYADELAALNARVAESQSTADRLALGKLFDTVFNQASREVQRESTRLQRPGMGATLLTATVVKDRAYIAHVGDSRAYLYRQGRLQQLTEDHTIAELHFRRGRITREEYESSPDRRLLYQVLGAGIEVDGDLAEVRLQGGDLLILCSDGLPRALDDDEMLPRLVSGDARNTVRMLMEGAEQAGWPDNISMIVLQFDAEDGDEDQAPITELMREVFLFRDMSPPELLTIAPWFEEVVHDKGETICSEGDLVQSFYVVVSGSVRASRGRTHLHDVKPGGHFGETALVRDRDVSPTIRTLAPTRLLELSRRRFLDLLKSKPELGARLSLALLDAVGERNRDLADRLYAVERALRGELK